MKYKKRFILLCLVLGMAIMFFGTAVGLKYYAGNITRQLSRNRLSFRNISLHYLPCPFIRIDDLVVRDNLTILKAVSVLIFPDIKRIFSSRIHIKDLILDKVFVLAQDTKGVLSNKSTNFGVPVSIESVDLKQGNILVKELGISFKGKIKLISFKPLRFQIKTESANLNLASIKEFLVKMGYIDQKLASMIPDIKEVSLNNLSLNYEPNKVALNADTVRFDTNQIDHLRFYSDLSKPNSLFSIQFKLASMALSQMNAWALKDTRIKARLNGFLKRFSLKEIKPEGELLISDLNISGTVQNIRDMKGSFSLKGDKILFRLISKKDIRQDLFVKKFSADVFIDNGVPSINIKELKISTEKGKTGKITGLFEIPFSFNKASLSVDIDSVRLFDSRIGLHLQKTRNEKKLSFDLRYVCPSAEIRCSKGMISIPSGQNEIYVSIQKSSIFFHKKQKISRFNFDFLRDISLIARLRVNSLDLNKRFEFNNLNLNAVFQRRRLLITGNMNFCNNLISIESLVLPPDNLTAHLVLKGIDLELTSFISCFSNELPVFLKGDLYLTGDFLIRGNSPDSIFDMSEGELIATVNRLFVYKLSNIDPRLSFFLDILRIAGMNIPEDDSIMFSRCLIKATLRKGIFEFKKFSLTGKDVNVWAGGSFIIPERTLLLSGIVKTKFGLKKRLYIEKKLAKGI